MPHHNNGPAAHKKLIGSQKVQEASQRIKEGMTVQQQAYIFHKEGRQFFDTGDIKGALDCFNMAISLNPMTVFYINRAACHKHSHQYTEAYFDYSFAIRLEPESGTLYCQRGLCLAKLERLTLAIDDLTEACKVRTIKYFCFDYILQ